ncbi:RNA polymerase sigma factor [Pararhizobium sp. IMCC21322]|uniref:RNA polymerase sigma factor n=1 Tax=Pararhizobium sp. IMCC21322 TaxID=3067903 RepID=UPI002740BEC0|nr:sigma-70 family RNA polymerase sigma factor [Pararhizobium sp. IMCC21322]
MQPSASKVVSDEAFEALVRDNLTWILRLAEGILNDAALAEDAAQYAFIKIHQGLGQFEGRSTLKTWMHRIVVNEALMLLRKNKQRAEIIIEAMLPVFDKNGCRIADGSITRETGETILTTKQTSLEVRRLIAELPDGYRIVLQLRDIEEMTTAQVALILDLSEANIKVRLHRARAALKKGLEPLFLGGAF